MIKSFGDYARIPFRDCAYMKSAKRELNKERSRYLKFLRGFIDFKIVSSTAIVRPDTHVGYKVTIDILGIKEN